MPRLGEGKDGLKKKKGEEEKGQVLARVAKRNGEG